MRLTLAGLSLRDIEYAVAVGQTLHFGRAAERCGISQPALSEQVRKLEDMLGVRLFERGNRFVRPTRRGAELLRQAERVLAEAHGLLELAHETADPLTGTLHLGAIATLGPYYLPHLLRLTHRHYPSLDLRLTEGQTAGLLDALAAGSLDTALLATSVPDRGPGGGLVGEALFFEPFRLVCPAGHRLATARDLRLARLAGAGLILLEDGHCLRDQALSLCRAVPAESRHATSIETLWHMIAAGEGYSLLPALSTGGREAMAELVACRELPDSEAGRVVSLVWRATDPRGPEFRLLAALLRENAPAGLVPPLPGLRNSAKVS